MVTSPHALASQAGLDVLAGGGNAVEAAIVITACLCVTYPHFCGLGGDAFLILADRAGGVQTISGIGQAPQQLPRHANAIPLRGPGSMLTTAALVDALGQAHGLSRDALGGQCSWAELLTPAIGLAGDGFPLTASERFWLAFRTPEAAALPGVYPSRLLAGQLPEVGQLSRQPDLAATLTQLAEHGYRDFYEGQLAARLARGLRAAGSPLTGADLARTRARIETPLALPYRDGTLLAHRPPTQGVTTLEIMGLLARYDLSTVTEGSADHYHLLVEAIKLAMLDRNQQVADPDFVPDASAQLLAPDYLDRQAARIQMGQAQPWPQVFQTGDTVFVGALDRWGNAVSLLATVYFDWGSGVQVGDTGLLWHNRGASFALAPGHPNQLAPGKRPFHTLNPGMYLKAGRPALLYGTQGADGQPQTLATVLTRLIDYGQDPLTALTRPRFLLGKTFSDSRDSLKLEADAPAAVFAELQRRGHALSRIDAQSPLAGHAGVIAIDAQTGLMTGAHDPRSDGRALGLAG